MIIGYEASTPQKKPYKDYFVLAVHKSVYEWFATCVGYFEGKGSKTATAKSTVDKVKALAKISPSDDLFFLGVTKKEAQHIDACVNKYYKDHPRSTVAKQAKAALDDWAIW